MAGAEVAVYDILGLFAVRHWRWGWVVAVVVLVLVVTALALTISAARQDVSGAPEEIAVRWNEASRGVPPTAEGLAARDAFVKHLRELATARAHADEDAADDARDRIAEDFKALRTLRVRYGLAK